MSDQIAAAEEQSSVAGEMNQNIVNIKNASGNTAEAGRQVAAAGSVLQETATRLKRAVERFRA